MSDLGLYWRYVVISFQAQMQFKVSFLLSAVGSFTVTIIEVSGIWALFTRFGDLPEWSLAQVCVFYGVVNISFALAEAVSTGFDSFGTNYIRNGEFDRVLLRPRGVVVQLLGDELSLRRLGRLAQGIVILIWALVSLDLEWRLGTPMLLLFAIAGGMCLFVGLFIFQATLSFWTVESLEIMNTLTYGGVETAQFPMTIYHPLFRRFFTLVVPLACVSYLPVVAALGVADPLGTPYWVQVCAPVTGFVFLAVALALFTGVGVRHYTSTGS